MPNNTTFTEEVLNPKAHLDEGVSSSFLTAGLFIILGVLLLGIKFSPN